MREKGKEHYHVLAVYSLEHKSGREHFSGILDEMSGKNWRLSTVRPGRFFSCKELVNEYGEPYDGFILSMPGTDGAMERIACSDTPTVLVNITDRRLSARRGNFANDMERQRRHRPSRRAASPWTRRIQVGGIRSLAFAKILFRRTHDRLPTDHEARRIRHDGISRPQHS